MAHAELFELARREYGPLHPSLHDFERHADEFIQPAILAAVKACERAAASGRKVDEAPLVALLRPAGPRNVWRLPLFTAEFCGRLLEELTHYEESGIPLRRPNGMNRYGAILDQLGMEASLDYLTRRFLRPLGQMLYPTLIGHGDADEHYGFAVRYKRGEDVSLAEHTDASVLTLNANLGYRGFSGGAVAFGGLRFLKGPEEAEAARAVEAHSAAADSSAAEATVDFAQFEPGEAILHLGSHYHSALPIDSGERANLIVWLMGRHDVVRVAPHEEADRLSAAQRWGAFAAERARASILSTALREEL